MDKKQLRGELKRCLLNMTTEQRCEKSRRACERLVSTPVFQDAEVVMLFLSLPDEVDTTEALNQAWQQAKTVVVPKIRWKDRHMEAVIVESMEDEFSVGTLGVRCPKESQTVPMASIDLVVTPGLGFDEQGNRLGRGAAFYDRFFHQQALQAHRFGFAFEEQVVLHVPTVAHDRAVDCVITDERVIVPTHR